MSTKSVLFIDSRVTNYQLCSHLHSREQALLGFSKSVENQVALNEVIQSGIELGVG